MFTIHSRAVLRSIVSQSRYLDYGRPVSSIVIDQQLNSDSLKLINEPILSYLSQSPERAELEQALKRAASVCADIPIVIGDEELRTSNCRTQVMPHNHHHEIAKYSYADEKILNKAIKVAVEAQVKWDRTLLKERIDIWNRAADLMAGKYRQDLNAATMLGQSKTVIQAEIDSSAELIDFIRMNPVYLARAAQYQPISTEPTVSKNSMRFRGIDGFVAAISPFNFTAIGGNLACTPALMGNAVLFKPSDTAVLSNWLIFKIMREAGLPPGVINFVPADGPTFGSTITRSKHLAAINFTGSVPTFNWLWKAVANNIDNYVNFPRLIGECGGKNYHFIHPTAALETVAAASIRAAFEYCGQKCSACSRMYVPESMWPKLKERLLEHRSKLTMGDPTDFSVFMAAVIDGAAFNRIKSFIDYARTPESKCKIIGGGKCDNSRGYFVEPTIIECADPTSKLMTEEIFGPVLAIHVYKDTKIDETIDVLINSTKYSLTGAVFAQDENFLKHAMEKLKMSAGNFYVNDKSTGSVVGQQPFGGGRMSGTNDKAGGPHYILKWTTPQSIKETFVPLHEITYPYMTTK